MPKFIGAHVPKERNQTAFKTLYEFNVVVQNHPDIDQNASLPAFATPQLDASHIAKDLAQSLGAERSGENIEVTLQEILFDGTISQFCLPVRANYSTPQRGPQYIQIGILDLLSHFDVTLVSMRDDRFLEISLKPDSDRECSEEPGANAGVVGAPVD